MLACPPGRVSYLEIYNEAVYDLLKFDKRQLQASCMTVDEWGEA